MTAKQAYSLVKKIDDGYPRMYLKMAYDFGDSYAFSFGIPTESDKPVIGASFDIINKKTGDITHRRVVDYFVPLMNDEFKNILDEVQ